MLAASQYLWSVKIHSFWSHLACFQNRMPQTQPDFVLMLGFYHNFSITSLKKIHVKFSGCCRNAVYLHYWALSSFALLDEDERYIYFQQDGARAHTSEQTMEFLCKFFIDRLVLIGLWPPQSPHLTPLDFFLWGHLKSKIFAISPATIEKLKWRITMEIQNSTWKMLRKVFQNMMRRTVTCKNFDGVLFQYML